MKRINNRLAVCQTFDEVIKAIVAGDRVYVPTGEQLLSVERDQVPNIKYRFDAAGMAIRFTPEENKEE